MKIIAGALLVCALFVSSPLLAQTPIRFLEFPSGSKVGDTLPLNNPIETNLPCNGNVRVSLSNLSHTPAASSYTIMANPNIPSQTLGSYNWTSNGNSFAMYNTTGTKLKYRVTFAFSNAADPAKLFLIVAGLYSSSTATVSTPVTKVAEYITPSAQTWCTTGCPNGSAPTVVTGAKLTSGFIASNGTDWRNTGFPLLRPTSTTNITSLSVDFEQTHGDGLAWTLAYICSPCACQGAPKPDPDFQLTATLNVGNTTTLQVLATTAPLPIGAGFSWIVEEIDASGNVIGPVMNNPSTWWSTPTQNSFSGYAFQQKRRYRITRGVWSDCYTWTAVTKVVYMCSACTQ